MVHTGFGACNEVVPVTSVPVTSIYCVTKFVPFALETYGAFVVLYYIVNGHTCDTPLYNNVRCIRVVMCVNAM